ncbi:PilX protein [Rheinheimera sp. YQF-2]|jgi:type IV pilus assembly protein PilX|uniref:PilX protein n=1 Tax=Rheinheimera lutimaris TaxID=2740584 RepID=A0A7Y5EH08_9GAMM|nr:pilus assembly protein [Rheinheimera lutimaris]NRQ41237.1 PilX protein [Rheinheimera lutimaris]
MKMNSQKGVALIVSLLLLLAITLLTISSMQRSTLQERMTANLYERQLAVQQIEAALRAAEQVLTGLLPNPATSAGTITGFYGLPVAGNVDRWANAATVWADAPVINQDMAAPAQYIIEYMGDWPSPASPDCANFTTIEPDCLSPTFRITARAVPANDRPQVVMQSIWRL